MSVVIKLNLRPHIERKRREIGRTGTLTQIEIAEATGIPQATVSRWINNKVDRYESSVLAALIEYFGCRLEDLFDVEYLED